MYNKEYKERFIAERENKSYLECQFKKVSSMEYELEYGSAATKYQLHQWC